jgi:anti-anti-sigma factor
MVLKFPERVSGAEARLFADRISEELRHDRPRVIADLSDVRQIDSRALHVMLECLVEVMRQDGEFYLGGVSPEAATVLELTQMNTVFELLPEAAEASVRLAVSSPQALPATGAVQPVAA